MMSQDFSRPTYRPDIDGLRAVAVLSVVLFHAFPKQLPGGFIGVDIFFVISGYLIYLIIFSNLLSSAVLGWFILLGDEYNQLGKHIASGMGFIANMVLWGESGYFDAASDTKPLLHLWSLAIEEQFYLVYPFLLYIGWKLRCNIGVMIAGCILLSFYAGIYVMETDPVSAFYLPQLRFWELMSGGLVAWIIYYKPTLYTATCHQQCRIENTLAIIGVSLLSLGLVFTNKAVGFPGYWALLPVLGSMAIILAGSQAWLNNQILSRRYVVWFGLISFPLYLWHWVFLSYGTILAAKTPSYLVRVILVLLSVLLAWLTYRFLEKPIRFGMKSPTVVVTYLFCSAVVVFSVGLLLYHVHFDNKRSFVINTIRGMEHAYGPSLRWYKGKGDWLFLGNADNDTVAKLKLAVTPTEKEIAKTTTLFAKVAKEAAHYNTAVALIVGPDKSNIYPEFLPTELVPATTRYSHFFIDKLKTIPNLLVYDPTEDLRRLKKTEGLLYWMTDTHWNKKGAFLAYTGFAEMMHIPTPQITFSHHGTHAGDLIRISQLSDFPLHAEDNWEVVWSTPPIVKVEAVRGVKDEAAGETVIYRNQAPLSDQVVWVIGDSFAGNLREYFSATFKEVEYLGHWNRWLEVLPEKLAHAKTKPDMVVIVRVERTF
jgi:peptidoglycan/LPS O-acetylase OafA/YrhL